MANISILSKSSLDLVIDLINAANTATKAKFDETKILVSNPTVLDASDASGHNTKAHVSAVKGGGYVGNVDVTYNRLDIGLLFKGIAANLDLGSTVPKTTKDLLDSLNARFGLGLTEDDIEDQPIDTSASQPWTTTVAIKTSSLAYLGTLTLTIGPDPEVGERLNTVVLTTNLNGLMYPNDDTSKAQAREYSWNIDANSISAWLEQRTTGDKIADNAFATELNKVVAELWTYDGAEAKDYNTANAEVVYAGVNDATQDTNQKFSRIVQFKLDETLCANMGGILTLGYNAI